MYLKLSNQILVKYLFLDFLSFYVNILETTQYFKLFLLNNAVLFGALPWLNSLALIFCNLFRILLTSAPIFILSAYSSLRRHYYLHLQYFQFLFYNLYQLLVCLINPGNLASFSYYSTRLECFLYFRHYLLF